MKRGMKIEINLTNRLFYSIIAGFILLGLGAVVYAYGTSSPSTFGHSAGEIQVTINGQSQSLQSALNSLGSGGKGMLNCTTIIATSGSAVTPSVTANCPADRNVTGGGCSTGFNTWDSYTYPATNGWTCVGHGFGGDFTITAYAVCCKII